MPRSTARATHWRRRWRNGAGVALALLLSACASAPVREDVSRGPMVRVGLLVDTTAVEVGSTAGFRLEDAGTGRSVTSFDAGERVTFTADPAGGLRYQASGAAGARSAPATSLVARPTGEGTLSIGGKPYRGAALVRVGAAGRVTAVNQVDMESYLLGVVPREIGTVGPELLQAAKAQAVAARTYAVRYMGRREALGFDVFATVQDQVYGGVEAEHDPVSRAVRETAGEILVYNGEPIEAFYHSTCAGRTAAIEEVWAESARPYLTSVVDVDPATGLAYDSTSSRFRWTVRWPAAQLDSILGRTLADSARKAGFPSVGQVRDIRVLERTASDRIRRMEITTTTGTLRVGGDRIRWVFLLPTGAALNSSKFDVQVVRDAQGRPTEFVATGGGWGHGIGMCQVGAMGRARAGQDYRTILTTYFAGTTIRDLY